MALTKAHFRMVDGQPANVKDFGATGDGTTDDTVAIQAALDSGAASVFFPKGTYRTTASIEIDGPMTVSGEGAFTGGSTIAPDASVLEAVKIGSNSIFGGAISFLIVERATFSSATENIGFALYDVANATFEGLNALKSKYNYFIKPQASQRVAYNQFINCTSNAGYWNWGGDISGGGYSNENVFIGCRFITSADTDTQFRLNWGGNFFRFIGCSMEGTADYGLYFNLDGGPTFGHSLFVQNCRFEGTFATARLYLGANSGFCTVLQNDLYGNTGIVDDGINNTVFAGPQSYFNRDGSGRTLPVLTVADKYASSGDANIMQLRTGRGSGKGIEMVNDVTDVAMGGLDPVGDGVRFRTASASWAYAPIQIGTYYLWVDTTGDLRIKNGAPTSDTDGTVVGTQS
jgi:hypothetical protein